MRNGTSGKNDENEVIPGLHLHLSRCNPWHIAVALLLPILWNSGCLVPHCAKCLSFDTLCFTPSEQGPEAF